ncbi:hypothetical protein B5F70_08025 [Collinsella sp. An268]|nr:hypothetical protein B5F70_08025 [Collinsella sp. An268]
METRCGAAPYRAAVSTRAQRLVRLAPPTRAPRYGTTPASINEISEELDINVATVRRDMRSLLEAGYIRATAPAQSKRRRYLLA